MMTRAEHLAWAKERALVYIDNGNLNDGAASFISDLGKHEELANHPAMDLIFMHQMSGLFTPQNARSLIEGTN